MLLAFLYYGPLTRETKTISHPKPSLSLFEDLHSKNATGLSCPCSKVSSEYSSILSIDPQISPICFNQSKSSSLELITHHRILSTLCSLSNEYIHNRISSFQEKELITIETMKKNSFQIQIDNLIRNFLREMKSEYRRRILFVMNSFHVNQLLNLFLRNWNVSFTNETENYLIQTIPQRFSSKNCSCAIAANCHENFDNQIEIGCLPFDGFRYSNYENLSLELLNNRLFVERWINQSFYENYFNQCQPIHCQYIQFDRNNPQNLLTNLLELYGSKHSPLL